MQNSTSLEKSNLRNLFKQKRLSLTKDEVVEKSHLINQNFIKNLLPKIYNKNEDKIFSLYLPSYNEVLTNELASYFIDNEIKFCYPKIIAKNQPLQFILHENNQIFVKNIFYKNLIEPLNGRVVVPDFLIIPLLAFDKNGLRLGMGGGFFDRSIEDIGRQKSQITTIGLAYDIQLFHQNLPKEKTDRTLDFIVSEAYIISGKTF